MFNAHCLRAYGPQVNGVIQAMEEPAEPASRAHNKLFAEFLEQNMSKPRPMKRLHVLGEYEGLCPM